MEATPPPNPTEISRATDVRRVRAGQARRPRRDQSSRLRWCCLIAVPVAINAASVAMAVTFVVLINARSPTPAAAMPASVPERAATATLAESPIGVPTAPSPSRIPTRAAPVDRTPRRAKRERSFSNDLSTRIRTAGSVSPSAVPISAKVCPEKNLRKTTSRSWSASPSNAQSRIGRISSQSVSFVR